MTAAPQGPITGSVSFTEAASMLEVSRPTVYRMVADEVLRTVPTVTGKGRRIVLDDVNARLAAASADALTK